MILGKKKIRNRENYLRIIKSMKTVWFDAKDWKKIRKELRDRLLLDKHDIRN